MNELSIVVIMFVSMVLISAITYSVGFKEGNREGYTRGRAISRHTVTAPKRDIYAQSSDVKAVK
jgi:hypothetical protein